MRFPEDKIRETAYVIAEEIVYGTDRFGTEDMQLFLDGIHPDDLATMRALTEKHTRRFQPDITEEYLKSELDVWVGSRVRCEGQRTAPRLLDAGTAELLAEKLERAYSTGYSPEYDRLRDEFEKRLYRVSQKDIDILVDDVYHRIDSSGEAPFLENRYANMLHYLLDGVQTAEYYRVRLAYQAENLDGPSLARGDVDWSESIAAYLKINEWQVGRDLSEALEVMGDREDVRDLEFPCFICDCGLAKLIAEPVAREVVYHVGQGETLLARPVILSDGYSYDKVRVADGNVILGNDLGGDCFMIDNVPDALLLCRTLKDKVVDLEEAARQNERMASAFALLDIVTCGAALQPDGSMRYDLPDLQVQGSTVRGVSFHQGMDGDCYYNLVYVGKEGAERESIGFNADRFVNYFRHLDDADMKDVTEYVTKTQASRQAADVRQEISFALSAPVEVTANLIHGDDRILVTGFSMDEVSGLRVQGRMADGAVADFPVSFLSDKSIMELFDNKDFKDNVSKIIQKHEAKSGGRKI